jgi:enediyne polyketide synthase
LALSAGVLAPPGVFVLGGGNARALADRLDVIAARAPVLSFAELWELARQLAVGAVRGCDEGGAVLRVALAPATPQQLAGQARQAARRLRTDGLSAAAAEPGVRISAGAAGNVVVVFPGLVESAAGHSALLAASLAGLRTLELAGVRPGAAVGYSLGEITGLVWAGSLPAAEAARLVAQRGQILLGCSSGPAAMARIGADARVARALCAPDRLHIAAYEGPRAQVLAGSIAGIRDMVRRAGAAGVAAEVLGVASAQHSPAMARCTAPLRSVLAGTPFAPPQRRLISTITGRPASPDDDIADLLARQLSLPVLFAQALMAATEQSERTDLIVTAGPDDGLAIVAAGCSGVPAIALPVTRHGTLDANSVISAQAVAALFAAGAVTDLSPFLAIPGSTLAAGTMPRMLDAEPHPGPGPEPSAVPLLSLADSGRTVGTDETVDHGSDRGTTARSG